MKNRTLIWKGRLYVVSEERNGEEKKINYIIIPKIKEKNVRNVALSSKGLRAKENKDS